MRRTFLYAIKITITAGLLFYLFRTVSLGDVWDGFRESDKALVLTFIPLMTLAAVIAGLQFKIFSDIHELGLSLRRILDINVTTMFYGLFLPGYLSGGVIRWYKISKENKKRMEAFTALFLNRWIHISFLIGLGLLGWLLEQNENKDLMIGLVLFLFFLFFQIIYLLSFQTKLLDWIEPVFRKYCRSNSFISDKFGKLIAAAREFQLLNFRQHVQVFCYATFWHLTVTFSTYCFCLALAIPISFFALLWIQTLVTAITMLPISISGFGVREGTLVYFFGLYGVPATEAITISFLIFARVFVQGFIGGMIELKRFLMPVRLP